MCAKHQKQLTEICGTMGCSKCYEEELNKYKFVADRNKHPGYGKTITIPNPNGHRGSFITYIDKS